MKFIDELRRRKVFRVAVVYAATAFVVIEAADLVLPALMLPEWTYRLLVLVTLFGFPVALVLGWAFELTPDGVRMTTSSPDSGTQPPPSLIGRRTAMLAGALVLVGIGLGAGWFLRPSAGTESPRDDGRVTVAVLPFQNMSGDAATEPFVLGIHDDLLTQLSHLDALRVVSRTSVMEYRNSPKNIRVISTELGADAVIEGGVQRAGDRVRVNVQLIDGRTDVHLWAETYNHELTAENIFAIQADIARSIARALHAELAPAEHAALDEAPTTNLAALELFHAARDAFQTGAVGRGQVAVRMFAEAVALDPDFAEAWAGMSKAHSWLVRTSEQGDTTPALEALERARQLAPDAVSTRLAEAWFHYYARADLSRALEAFEVLYRVAPGSLDAIQGLAAVERRMGRLPDALVRYREAARLDPRTSQRVLDEALTIALAGDPGAARLMMERALRLGTTRINTTNTAYFGLLLWELGDTLAARRFVDGSTTADTVAPVWRAELALVHRDYVTAASEAAAARANFGPFSIGVYFMPADGMLSAKIAWLAGDRAAVERWTNHVLTAADSQASTVTVATARWGDAAAVHLQRALAYAFRGDTASALREAAEAARFPLTPDVLTGTAVLDHLVVVDILTGRHDQAIDRIEHLLSMPSFMKPARLRLDPIYDALRSNPRFRALAGEQS